MGHLFNPVLTLGYRMVSNHEADLQAWRVKSKVGDTESRLSGSPRRARVAVQCGVHELEKHALFRCIRRLALSNGNTRAELCRIK